MLTALLFSKIMMLHISTFMNDSENMTTSFPSERSGAYVVRAKNIRLDSIVTNCSCSELVESTKTRYDDTIARLQTETQTLRLA